MPSSRLRRALRDLPCSLRALSLDAGVHVSLLYRILDGEKRLTTATACALADALDDWSARCERAADALRPTKG